MLIVCGSHWTGSPGRVRLGHSWDHPGVGNTLAVGSNKALEAPRLFGDKEGLSSAGDKFVVVFLGQGEHVGAGTRFGLL